MSWAINHFRQDYYFLSNFYPCLVHYYGRIYRSAEHAYQAAKAMRPEDHDAIQSCSTAGQAKRLGRTVLLRPEWDERRVDVMRAIVRAKFESAMLARRLVDTHPAKLVEGNGWGDTFWGQSPVGTGFNHLGLILMEVRAELRRP